MDSAYIAKPGLKEHEAKFECAVWDSDTMCE